MESSTTAFKLTLVLHRVTLLEGDEEWEMDLVRDYDLPSSFTQAQARASFDQLKDLVSVGVRLISRRPPPTEEC